MKVERGEKALKNAHLLFKSLCEAIFDKNLISMSTMGKKVTPSQQLTDEEVIKYGNSLIQILKKAKTEQEVIENADVAFQNIIKKKQRPHQTD